jgi:hypothetical protein
MAVNRRGRTIGHLAAIGTAVCAMSAMLYVMMRWSLLLLLLVAIPSMLWTVFRRRELLLRRLGVLLVSAVVLAALPIDIAWARGDRFQVRVRPLVWGLPGARLMERVRAGEVALGGCVVPMYPARCALVVSW